MKYILLLLILVSCSTSKKIKNFSKSVTDSVSTTKIDSVAHKAIDSTSVKKDNTVTTKETEGSYTKETIIEFDTTSKITPADYFPPVKRITVRETGIKKEKIAIIANLTDSSSKISTDNTDLNKEVKTDLHKKEVIKNKDKKITTHWWLIGLLVGVLIWITGAFIGLWSWFGWWFWLVARFKKKEQYPIRYSKYQLPKKDV